MLKKPKTTSLTAFSAAKPRCNPFGIRAFNLLDLLVVIAMIATLAAMLLPALAKAQGARLPFHDQQIRQPAI